MKTILLYLPRIIEAFRFVKKARERAEALRLAQAAEKQNERDHMVDLMDTMLGRVEKIVEHHAAASRAQAEAASKMAEPLAAWFEMLRKSNEGTEHLTTSTVRAADERDEEERRERQRLIEKGFPIDKSDAEKLQWLVDQDEL